MRQNGEMPIGRSILAQTALVSASTLAAISLLGLVLAYWTWTWFAPRPEPRAEVTAEPAARIGAANGLFGQAQRSQVADAPSGLAIKLLGVVAATEGRPGYAVVQLDAKQVIAVRAGEDVAPGIRLDGVYPDHVTLERVGARESLALAERQKSAVVPVPGPAK